MLPQNLGPFVWHFLKPYKRIVVLYIFLALLAGFWGPFNSLLMKYIINILSAPLSGGGYLLVWPAALVVLNFVVFDNVTWRTLDYLDYKFLAGIKNKIRAETFQFVLGLSHQFFQETLSGRIASQIQILAENIERIISPLSKDLLRGASLLLIALVSAYYVNTKFFYTLALWFVAFFSFSLWMMRILVHLSDKHTGSESMIAGQFVDSITNTNNIRIFARETYEALRMESFFARNKEAFQKKAWFLFMLYLGQGSLIAIMLGFMGYNLISLYVQQLVTIGDFALIFGLSMEVGHMTWWTMSQVSEFHQVVGKCKQSLSQLIVSQAIKDKSAAQDLVVKEGQIRFSNVTFHYKGTKALFRDKSVTIKGGQKVGLVGYSGSGKSTFVNLILRLYEVTDGHIFIDQQDLQNVTQSSLHSQISVIPQDPSLFHRTLMENIRYGRLEASDEEVMEAARKAHAHEFIMNLSEGYQSLVGERGIKLSGGQRQRIAIARAILKNAPILILDEATSQLDSITEENIQDSLWVLMEGKTTLVIAHRLSTLLYMDRILVFDQGKIVEDGPHAKLINKKGLYKTMWDAQVGGFLPDQK